MTAEMPLLILLFFCIAGNFVPCYTKTLRGDRAAAGRKLPFCCPPQPFGQDARAAQRKKVTSGSRSLKGSYLRL